MAEKKRFFNKQRWLLIIAGLCITLLVLILYLVQPALLRQTDRYIYDIFLRASAGGTPSGAPAIIDIDEASLREYGQWPWATSSHGKTPKKPYGKRSSRYRA